MLATAPSAVMAEKKISVFLTSNQSQEAGHCYKKCDASCCLQNTLPAIVTSPCSLEKLQHCTAVKKCADEGACGEWRGNPCSAWGPTWEDNCSNMRTRKARVTEAKKIWSKLCDKPCTGVANSPGRIDPPRRPPARLLQQQARGPSVKANEEVGPGGLRALLQQRLTTTDSARNDGMEMVESKKKKTKLCLKKPKVCIAPDGCFCDQKKTCAQKSFYSESFLCATNCLSCGPVLDLDPSMLLTINSCSKCYDCLYGGCK